MSNNSVELIATLVISAIIIVVAVCWSTVSEYVSCKSYGSITDRTTKYSLISGCYVKTDAGHWVPREEMTKTAVVQGSK